MIEPARYVRNFDFHDGHILAVVKQADSGTVTIKRGSDKHYIVTFEGVCFCAIGLPKGLMRYGR